MRYLDPGGPPSSTTPNRLFIHVGLRTNVSLLLFSSFFRSLASALCFFQSFNTQFPDEGFKRKVTLFIMMASTFGSTKRSAARLLGFQKCAHHTHRISGASTHTG
jgi:hypothetical protein